MYFPENNLTKGEALMQPILAWYLLGVLTYLLMCLFCFDRISVADLIYALFLGIFGPTLLILLSMVYFLLVVDSFSSVTIVGDKKEDD